MSSIYDAELQQYLALALELNRRVFAEEEPLAINSWLATQVAMLGGASKEDNAVMTWEESFAYYESLLLERAAMALLPADQRKVYDWPWASWNKLIDPLEPGMLVALTAGDGQGKTILAECLAEYWARRGYRVVFAHFELNRGIMLDRRAARQTGIQRRVLKAGEFRGNELGIVKEMGARMRQWAGGITYLHTPGWTMEKMLGTLRALRTENLCDIVLVDYLEKVSASPRQQKLYGNNQNQREADDVEQLKNFGEINDIPFVMLAQMNKANKTASASTIDRTGMRGAGEKSEKANVVILLHRDKGEDNNYSKIMDVIVDKNTLGATGAFQQVMIPERFDVADLKN